MSWNISDEAIFIIMVFAAAFLLVQSFMVPAFGENRRARKRLKKRLRDVHGMEGRAGQVSLVRSRFLRELSPVERWLEALPGMARLERLIEQAGRDTPAYRVVLKALLLGGVSGVACVYLLPHPAMALAAGAVVAAYPFVRLSMDKSRRLTRFEEQLPDALIIMSRALRAGHPFSDALRLVADEMQDPISSEFRTMFTEINYGGEVRMALAGLLNRVESVTAMVFVTSVLIQKDTGGNLAELLDGLAEVVRDRFRFHRKLRTLTAQGKMAAWVLSLMPFALAGVLSVANPNFLPMLTQDPTGRQLVLVAFVLMVIGILWMRRIVRVDI
ncbi:type II secretion system F family protein [Aquisalimonas sp.]|uniref:type II secretion system F family protein n=1 Tax=Aquisalimonas sp. TaxID=1872621 RepID=UPI0025BF230D|nr:type II secretion system F family protein [Aquisalimonas sp.]